MTRRLYNEDGYLQSFRAAIMSCEPYKEKMYQVVLDRTAFFPEGGGQSSDTGWIEYNEKRIPVLDVQEENDEVYHIISEPIACGSQIEGNINWEERFDKMQQHTAEHIASGIIDKKYGFQNVGFHLNCEIVTMDFDGVITREQGNELEEEINEAVTRNAPVYISYPTSKELELLSYRSKIQIEGQVRIVQVEGYDMCACCAPHVRTTGEIGMVKLTDIQSHRGGVRITMVCGKRALLDYQEKSANTKGISVLLSTPEKEVLSSVEHLKEELQSSKSIIWGLQRVLIDYKVKNVESVKEELLLFEEDLGIEHARELVNRLVEKGMGVVLVMIPNLNHGFQYIIGSQKEDVRNICKVLNEKCQGRGGGKPMMAQGSVVATREEVEIAWKEIRK